MKKIIRELYLIPVYLYKGVLSGFGGPCCRYTPSCSTYFVEAVLKHGIFKGTMLGFARLFRCSGRYLGGPDPVPDEFSFKEMKEKYRIYRKPKDY